MKIQTLGFDWDSGNKRKCRKHGLRLIMSDMHHSRLEERYIAYGQTRKGRPMFVAFTFRIRNGEQLIRPISARYMHEKEAREYEEKSTEI
jgi:uncharacterized DUF497 family protein